MKNEEIILWKMDRKKNAYKDQYGVPHEAIVVEEEVAATVVEDKTLPIGGSKYSTTFATKAKSEDGRFFCLSSDWYPDWRETDSEFKEVKAYFKDAISESNKMKWENENISEDDYMIPVIRENGDLAIPRDVEKCTCSHSESSYDMKSHYYYKPNGHCKCFFLKEL